MENDHRHNLVQYFKTLIIIDARLEDKVRYNRDKERSE